MSEHPIVVLVASMSGVAEMVADEVADKLNELGHKARVVRMEKASQKMLDARDTYVICSSTYGTGEVPDNGKPFHEFLTKERPNLSHVRYGVIALGSQDYPQTFCGGGKAFDATFADLGAKRLVDRMEHDAKSGIFPEEAALEWLEGWTAALSEELA
ncbi:sulfite reductase [Phaeobacter inhibens]|uniref:flavodoxin domain-containing protein n=1 Tax=Phaeobacter inhibens TaxID=221822 RepID=UPI002748F5CB|nr:flavodoxin domain-containing protein [Phaeobacter inhibens]GLO69981.1 sulfite reductase [Phaeobacter inhibens]